MIRPFTVVNWPVITLPVTMVKVLPIAGIKLLMRLMFSVPLRLTPLELANWLYLVPTVVPPMATFKALVEPWL